MKKSTVINSALVGLCCLALGSCVGRSSLDYLKNYDYTMINSPEEAGMIFTRVTPEKATVLANTSASGNYLSFDGNKQQLVYLSKVGNDANLYLLDLNNPNVSQQRTFRNNVDGGFSISSNSQDIVFCSGNEILTTNINAGSICKQITSNNKDYCPVFAKDASKIFFNRNQNVWSYDVKTKEMAMYGEGYCPTPSSDDNVYVLKDSQKDGKSFVEIRRVNYVTGTNDVILSNEDYRPRYVSVSPDGQWLLFAAHQYKDNRWNTSQIYVMRSNGTELTQITYHEGGNYSPVWGEGNSIYFISGRGDKDKRFAIWRTVLDVNRL